MSTTVLRVSDLTTHLGSTSQPVRVVDGVSFDIAKGETFALVGESGCGKSMTALSLMRLLPAGGRIVDGRVEFAQRELLKYSEADMRRVRGGGLSMIFQEPMTSLNPVLTVGQQIGESLATHQGLTAKLAKARVLDMLDAVGIPDPKQRTDEYPHQLSGGMKQRVMIAIALANEPSLLIADEPTTALDVTIQAQVLELIKQLQQQRGMAVLLITHDLGVVAEMADRVAVMYAGQIVEQSGRAEYFTRPKHPYSQKLFDSLPGLAKRGRVLNVISGFVPSLQDEFSGCRFVARCDRALPECADRPPPWSEDGNVRCHLYAPNADRQQALPKVAEEVSQMAPDTTASGGALLTVHGLKIHFPIQAGILKRTVGHVRAVDGVDIAIGKGRTLALVGESGCGKTTIGKGVLHLLRPTAGTVTFAGEDLSALSRAELRRRRANFQIIFQDPYSSMNPRMLVADIIAEGLRAQDQDPDPNSRDRRISELLGHVGLTADSMDRYPHEFSGGQRQRISIARALAVKPSLIVCDEPTSALDVSVQAQILNLLKDLQREFDISYLFISHNISVVSYLAHELAVMYLGRIVEHGPVAAVMEAPRHPYTRALLSSVPVIDAKSKADVIRLQGDMPSPAKPPSGCFFHPRCGEAHDACHSRYPESVRVGDGHVTSCHLYPGP